MNPNHSIEFSNVWKKYRIGEIGAASLHEELSGLWGKLVNRRSSKELSEDGKHFWALQGLDLSVVSGDIHGIIGKNGAGKSTLLKILSRITTPTHGEIRYRGKVASLLEVGTGFHPELTGKENIYLNGAIMGMSRKETTSRMAKIIEFSDCGKFINTPVKRYSSGMLVRLGFSVAAHLDSNIMIVDEVLAVGDQDFQNRCIDKMQQNARDDGKTIVFVSHNFATVRALCNRCSVIENGAATTFNSPVEAIAYSSSKIGGEKLSATLPAVNSKPSITYVSVNKELLTTGTISVVLEFSSPTSFNAIPGITISNSSFEPIIGTNGRVHKINNASSFSKSGKFECTWQNVPLYSGTYYISVWLSDLTEDFDQKEYVLQFDFHSTKAPHLAPNYYFGQINIEPEWTMQS